MPVLQSEELSLAARALVNYAASCSVIGNEFELVTVSWLPFNCDLAAILYENVAEPRRIAQK